MTKSSESGSSQARPWRFSAALVLALLAGGQTWQPAHAAASAPRLMLANVYMAGASLQDYWVSEKYDGVRGYWDGQQLFTRGGEAVAAPAWFTAGWPETPLDGELWAGRGQFGKAVSTVRQKQPDDAAWRNMRFMVFDMPGSRGPFTDRIPLIAEAVARIHQPWVNVVLQTRATDEVALRAQLTKTVKLGGEGLMLHKGASLYQGVRSDDLLKVKTHDDTEAQVVAQLPGKGKYNGKLGALLVELPATGEKAAIRFKLGTGFSDRQRLSPPPVGAWVTFRYRGFNDSGVPRFASFMRVREN